MQKKENFPAFIDLFLFFFRIQLRFSHLTNERGHNGRWLTSSCWSGWNPSIGISQGYVDLAPDVSHWPMREANVADGMLLLVRVLWIWRQMDFIGQ